MIMEIMRRLKINNGIITKMMVPVNNTIHLKEIQHLITLKNETHRVTL